MTYRELTKKHSDIPKNEINTLICHVCGLTDTQLLSERDSDIPDRLYEELSDGIRRLTDGEPIQYITNKAYFYGLDFHVDPRVLIPRFDTETVTEYCIKNIPQNAVFADICCGSGCIGISILKNRHDLSCIFADISDGALQISRSNSERWGVADRATFITFDALDKSSYDALRGLSAVVSNPPYIRSSVVHTLEKQVLHEPHIALDGGTDGLDFYRAITENCTSCFEKNTHIIYEIGYDQADDICITASKNGLSCRIINDLSGNCRVAVLN